MNYTSPAHFEPLLPRKNLEELESLAKQIMATSLKLKNSLHVTTRETLMHLLREMNSYYSNKIEGHSTHPVNIARGLRHDFSKQPTVAQLQRLAIAHIEAEIEIESWLNAESEFNTSLNHEIKNKILPFSPFSMEGIRRIHEAFYQKLSRSERMTEEGSVVEPGVWRQVEVQVGHHIPPTHDTIPLFLKRYEDFYDVPTAGEKQLIKIASAHHRLAWIHPFVDGNGRVARLATHAALYRDFGAGLWSICRGLARTQPEYYERLQDADSPRRGDFDGRGNLSEIGLWHFCKYFLTVCVDQVSFMEKMLEIDGMRKRIAALLIFRSREDKQIRLDAELPLHYLFTSGPLTRAEFKQMTGLGDKVAQSLLSRLLKTGLVLSDTPLGPVRFGLPLDALPFYFPDLYPEANMSVDQY